jgi:hypothetical protein
MTARRFIASKDQALSPEVRRDPAWSALRAAYEQCLQQAREAKRTARKAPFQDAVGPEALPALRENVTLPGVAQEGRSGTAGFAGG